MNQALPTVSVLLSVHNGEEYLPQALRSVLGQQDDAIELIAVDDGSTDDSREVVAQFGDRVRSIWQENQGLSAARNTEQIEEEPAPFVLQTALDDNYVAYELNAFTKNAGLRPKIYSDLHANILDAFHAAGVEITSPHYRAVRDGNAPAIAEVIRPEPGEETRPA